MLKRLLALFLALSALGVAEGGKEHPVQAFVHATVWVRPGVKLEDATVVVRDGRIEGVGQVPVPAEARIWDMRGKTLAAGFLDPYVTITRLKGDGLRREPDAPRPEDAEEPTPFKPDPDSGEFPRLHPDWLVSQHLGMKDETVRELRAQGFVGVLAVPDQGAIRGTAAFYSLTDGPDLERLWDGRRAVVAAVEPVPWDDFKSMPYGTQEKLYPESLMGHCSALRQSILDARWYARARQLDAGSYLGDKRPRAARAYEAMLDVAEGRELIVLETHSAVQGLSLRRSLDEVGVSRRATVLSGEEWRCLDWLRPHGGESFVLPVDFPAKPEAESAGEWLDVSDRALLGWRNAPALARWLGARQIPFCFTTHRLKELSSFAPALHRSRESGCPTDVMLAALTTEPARVLGYADRLGTLEKGKSASFVVLDGPLFGAKTNVRETWVEGRRYTNAAPSEEDDDSKPDEDKPLFAASDYNQAPETASGPVGTGSVLVRGATLWTMAPGQGPRQADLLVVNGKVSAVGTDLSAPAGALVVDGTGLHVTPGIIDCHSHTAIEGDVNEYTFNCSSMVRIKDVINPLDVNIRRQLAGGVTAANLLHGSANTIGGQTVVVKYKWGLPPEQYPIAGAHEGIKFALGENPRQANDADLGARRYPATRMGVAASIRERFTAAKAYREEQRKFAAGQRAVPVKPDLQLDALLEILDGQRYVHCHSYRQDEILMLIRSSEELGFHVRTFQHVLEGYKVADEIAAHGAGASTFSDWWAYKIEVMDAIPQNGAVLARHGVVTSFNSDSDELARRLNTEAAKAVRYGDLSEVDALAFVTLNPARQLGLEGRLGSLEPGKDGDFVLWSANPLTQGAVCQQTWIEGRRYFDRHQEQAEQALREARRRELIARAKKK